MVTTQMREAGDKIAADLVDVSLIKSLGGLGGSRKWEEWYADNKDNPFLDLLVQVIDDKLDSVTAIYMAMERAKEGCATCRHRV
jgi:hypothetical protein